jgi:hypothetical protein
MEPSVDEGIIDHIQTGDEGIIDCIQNVNRGGDQFPTA